MSYLLHVTCLCTDGAITINDMVVNSISELLIF